MTIRGFFFPPTGSRPGVPLLWDEFFSEDKAFYDRSGTFLRLRTDIIRDERGAVHTVADFRLKLRMPNTKKKVNVVVESDTDTRKDEVASPTDTTPVEQQDKKKYFIGVQGSVGKQEHWRFKPSVGLRLSSDVNVYVKFRISRLYEFDKWSFHFNENFYSFRTTGSGADTSFDISNKVNENTLFRSSSLARWTHETQYFELSQTFSMLHTLSKRRAVSYYIGAYGKSEPVTHATHYLIGASYRQNIHKDYLFVELIPQIQFKKINNFDAEYSFILRLEMIFKK